MPTKRKLPAAFLENIKKMKEGKPLGGSSKKSASRKSPARKTATKSSARKTAARKKK